MTKKCGIIYFDNQDQKYLLVYGKKSDKWGFPKGHQEFGETEEETAMREFFEETGIPISATELLDKIRFKNNIYFNVNANGKPKFNIQDTNEIEKASWFSINEIMNLPKDVINYGLKSWLNQIMMDVFHLDYRIPKFIESKEPFKSKLKYY
jgi:tRNA nucleotidyltransferase (CCA-adding enzyme)